jgi:glycosyltransferase involved in cell wall biosynthesis
MLPPTVVITTPWGERLGGAENMLWMFLKHLDRGQIAPMVVFFQPGSFVAEVSGLGIPTVVVPTGRLRHVGNLARATWALYRLLRRHKPDLLVNWSAKTQLYAAMAALLAGRGDRVVWWQHGISTGQWMDRLASLLPARAVGCSSRSAAEAQERFAPRRRTFVVNPGIERPQALTDDELDSLRSRLGIPPDKLTVGTVGRLQPWRRHDRVLRTLASLRQRGHDVHGLIVGGNAYNLSPGYESELLRLVDELGLRDAVTFTGQVSDAVPYIQLMQVLVNPSRNESFGIALLEAMAVGVPIVAFDGFGPGEIVESDRSGLLVPPENEAAFTETVERLLSDSHLRRRLAEAGRRRFDVRFTVQHMRDELTCALLLECRGRAEALAVET